MTNRSTAQQWIYSHWAFYHYLIFFLVTQIGSLTSEDPIALTANQGADYNLGKCKCSESTDLQGPEQWKYASMPVQHYYFDSCNGSKCKFLIKFTEKYATWCLQQYNKILPIFCIGCGGRKSMSWTIPVVRNTTSKGFKAKMSIVIR